MIHPLDLAALLVVLAAAMSWLNHKLLRLPHAIGLTVLGLGVSLCTAGIDHVLPGYGLGKSLASILNEADFNHTLMNGMLSFLLFAGALQLDIEQLHAGRRAVLILSVAGVLISTLVTGYLFYGAALLLHVAVPLPWCLMFGALISPTDPVAVIAILRRAGVPLDVETRICAESLFNDGVGVVVFSITAAAALQDQPLSIAGAASIFAVTAIGGSLFGLVLGWIAYRSLKGVDDPVIETMITLALVMGGYSLSQHFGFSPVVAMAVAGVVIAAKGASKGMSERSRDYIFGFWATIEELLNSVLFLLIGLEVIVILRAADAWTLAVAAIPIVLLSRAVSVGVPMEIVSLFTRVDKRSYPVFVWGGLRGGIPIALALSLPHQLDAKILLTATYCVVLFSLIVQGGTLKWLGQRIYHMEP